MVETDLSDDIPQQALDIRDDAPSNPLDEWDYVNAADEGYDGRSGNLSGLIEDANSNGELVYCPAGEYEMDDQVGGGSGLIGVVGDDSDDTTIYYSGQSEAYLFNVSPSTFVLDGVTFDISEDFGGEGQTDVGLASSTVSTAGWYQDIWFVGQRAYNQHLGGSWTTIGGRFTFLMEAESGATVYAYDCNFPDGGTDEADGIGSTVGHAIGPNSDPGHHGYAVWDQCYCERFQDNGFYMGNSPGTNVLIDCTAINNSASNFRPGDTDIIIGGYSEQTDTPAGRHGTCIEVDSASDDSGPDETTNATVIGLEMYGREDHYGNEAIQMRQNNGEVTFDRCTLDVDGENVLVRADSFGLGEHHFEDCFFWLRGTGASAFRVENADVTAENLHILHEDGDEVNVQSSGSFTYEGTSYSGTNTASDIGMDDPRPLPEFNFGDDEDPDPDPEEADVVFEIVDAVEGDPIEGAGVTLRPNGS